MDIVQFLKPKYVLMEIYALSRLVHMKYQARLGTVAAGCYGLPQFRLRVFLWGLILRRQKLPQFPLPSHDVIVRYWPPPESTSDDLEKATVLRDAISDLPDVGMAYDKPPETDFQQFIRSTRNEMTGSELSGTRMINLLYDHPNFRDLPGVVVGADNVARRDPTKEQVLLPSGKPWLVPDFALNFEGGKSRRPYARLWWDETVSTVVTYPDLHSQAVMHPEQDRVLTIRECARLQGFPDYYRFCGTVKQRYRQIGNAVAVPVGRALGFTLGMAFQKLSGDDPLMTLPPKFSHSSNLQLAKSLFQKAENMITATFQTAE
ncbi:DNA methyltransferase [Salix suchowensis]|nr:DNA methyltransferase [Salix suchowensis]